MVTSSTVNDLWAGGDGFPASQTNQGPWPTAYLSKMLNDTARSPTTRQLPPTIALDPTQEEGHPGAGYVVSSSDHEEMPDVSIDIATLLRAPATPLPDHSASSASSILRDMAVDGDEINLFEQGSLEVIREQRAAIFDCSALDSFLEEQAEPEMHKQTNLQDLAKTQLWGRIDPRVSWAPVTDEDWLVAKRSEIDARGGRKANYGKHLTSQVRKEREDKGWYTHQNSEAVSDQIMAETLKHMEELFGINIDNLLPSVRDGQLVMVEKSVDEVGRKKRKAVLKCYPVF